MPEPSSARVRGSGATVTIEADRVVKRQAPELSKIERERTLAGSALGRESGLFRVPDIHTFNDECGEIVFERLLDAVPLRSLLRTNRDPTLVQRAGSALAAIHRSDGGSDDADVTWHGDYGFGNVLYDAKCDELVVIDWSNASWTGEPADRARGPAAMDIGIALISLFHGRLAASERIADPEELGAIFMNTYANDRPDFNSEALRQLMPELSRLWRRVWRSRRGTLSAVAHLPSAVRLAAFVRRARTEPASR